MPLRNGVQYASIITKKCPMYDPVCVEHVIKHLAVKYPPGTDLMPLIESSCGRYVRGNHKGQLRGWASIEVVTEGGWRRSGPGERNGRVVRPGMILQISIGDDFTGKTYLVVP